MSSRHEDAQPSFRHYVEYLVLRATLVGLEFIGPRLSNRIGRTTGHLLYRLDAEHRQVVVDNLMQAEGVVGNETEALRLAREVYGNLGILISEMATAWRSLRKRHLGGFVRLGGKENLEAALSRGKGAIISFGHLGNWEVAGIESAHRMGRSYSVYRPMDNPLVDRFFLRMRTRTGMKMISKFNAGEKMRQVLSSNALLYVLPDQNVREGGVFVDFFGRPASTVKSIAILALRYGAPIVPMEVHRENGRIHASYQKPIWPDDVRGERDRVRALTQLVTRSVENSIRRHPEQWFWFHRRWKTRPNGK